MLNVSPSAEMPLAAIVTSPAVGPPKFATPVTVIAGPWRASLFPEAPFDLLFVGARDAKADPDAVVGLLAPGATVVLDDFRADPAPSDPRRDAWLRHPLLSAIELWVTPERRALVAVRR